MKITKLYTEISLIEKKFKKDKIFYFIKTPNVAITIAKSKNKFLIVSQKRIAINKTTYEFPGGFIDKGFTALQTAKNELHEETGYKCLKNPKQFVSFYPEPGRLKCKYFCFFTDKVLKKGKPEKDINLHLLSKNQIFNLIKKNKFNHASHIYAFLSYLNLKK